MLDYQRYLDNLKALDSSGLPRAILLLIVECLEILYSAFCVYQAFSYEIMCRNGRNIDKMFQIGKISEEEYKERKKGQIREVIYQRLKDRENNLIDKKNTKSRRMLFVNRCRKKKIEIKKNDFLAKKGGSCLVVTRTVFFKWKKSLFVLIVYHKLKTA